MNVENFWRQLKHDYLHHVAQPRLDTLVWILINKVTPAYIARAEILNDNHRLGRPKQFTTYQKYFKSSWKELQKRKVSGKEYDTNIAEWNCTCGRQKYDRHHLCKHLVQAVESPPKRFWREVVRRRVQPIYRHPALVAIGDTASESGAYIEPDGSITDGDDHIWSGDRDVLKGGGGWRQAFTDAEVERVLGKRRRSSTDIAEKPRLRVPQEPQDAVAVAPPSATEVIDLTMDSSPEPDFGMDEKGDTDTVDDMGSTQRSSSPIEYGSEGEEEVSENIKLSSENSAYICLF